MPLFWRKKEVKTKKFKYKPQTEPLQPVIEEIKAGNLPLDIKCKPKGKATAEARARYVEQRLHGIFADINKQFRAVGEEPIEWPIVSVKGKVVWLLDRKEKSLGALCTPDGREISL